MSNTTTRPNPLTAFQQMQKAQATRAAIEEELAKPKTYTSESPDFKVETPKPTLAGTDEPVDIDRLIGINPELDVHDLDGVDPKAVIAADAELTALSGKIDIMDDGTWENEARPDYDSLYRSSWLCKPAEVGLGNWRGSLRQFVEIDERDPMDMLNDDEFVGFHAARM